MKKWIQGLSLRQWISWGSCFLCLLFVLVISLVEGVLQKQLYDQQAAARWSKEKDTAQVSAYFSADAEVEDNYFLGVKHQIDAALQEASILTENENARLWIDALSLHGKVRLKSDRTEVELKAVGVNGDFFQFHPVKLKYGSYFNNDSMMQDNVIIDEETAWQLFGGSDVVGMQVTIAGVPHRIGGVIDRETGRLAEAAGLKQPICYLSLDSLKAYGSGTGQYTYEVLLPNPVSGFALSTLTKQLEGFGEQVELVENSNRYQLMPRLLVLRDFGLRSMSHKGILYPYWENIARGYEDIFALTLLLKILLLLWPIIFAVIQLVGLKKYITIYGKEFIKKVRR